MWMFEIHNVEFSLFDILNIFLLYLTSEETIYNRSLHFVTKVVRHYYEVAAQFQSANNESNNIFATVVAITMENSSMQTQYCTRCCNALNCITRRTPEKKTLQFDLTI